MVCSPPGPSVHGILQARTLERAAISFSRGSSGARDATRVSCLAGRFFTTEPPGKPSDDGKKQIKCVSCACGHPGLLTAPTKGLGPYSSKFSVKEKWRGRRACVRRWPWVSWHRISRVRIWLTEPVKVIWMVFILVANESRAQRAS